MRTTVIEDKIDYDLLLGLAETPCGLCGRQVDNPVGRVHFIGGGMTVLLHPDDGDDYDDSRADMGFWPVGASCAKRVPKGYLLPPFGVVGTIAAAAEAILRRVPAGVETAQLRDLALDHVADPESLDGSEWQTAMRYLRHAGVERRGRYLVLV